jgi:hypothetical protein
MYLRKILTRSLHGSYGLSHHGCHFGQPVAPHADHWYDMFYNCRWQPPTRRRRDDDGADVVAERVVSEILCLALLHIGRSDVSTSINYVECKRGNVAPIFRRTTDFVQLLLILASYNSPLLSKISA